MGVGSPSCRAHPCTYGTGAWSPRPSDIDFLRSLPFVSITADRVHVTCPATGADSGCVSHLPHRPSVKPHRELLGKRPTSMRSQAAIACKSLFIVALQRLPLTAIAWRRPKRLHARCDRYAITAVAVHRRWTFCPSADQRDVAAVGSRRTTAVIHGLAR